MFTGRPLPPLPPVLRDEAYADGFVFQCPQDRLTFGSDRKTPVPTRPVVRLRRDGTRVLVLPCTTKQKMHPSFYFELTPERVQWLQPNDRRSFAFYRYESVPAEALLAKIGVMPHPARIALMQWLKERYR